MNTNIELIQINKHLSSIEFEWELDGCGNVIFQDVSDYGCDNEFDLLLPTHFFKKEIHGFPRRSSGDPCDIISLGEFNIDDYVRDEPVRDEWDGGEVCEVFMNNINQITIQPC